VRDEPIEKPFDEQTHVGPENHHWMAVQIGRIHSQPPRGVTSWRHSLFPNYFGHKFVINGYRRRSYDTSLILMSSFFRTACWSVWLSQRVTCILHEMAVFVFDSRCRSHHRNRAETAATILVQ